LYEDGNISNNTMSNVCVINIVVDTKIKTNLKTETSVSVASPETIILEPEFTGDGPLSYQWYKNGSAMSGMTTTKL
jgi:hypothetical protein